MKRFYLTLILACSAAATLPAYAAMIHGHKGFTESEHQALHADWDAALSVQADPSGGTEELDDITSNNGDVTKTRHE